MASLPPLNPRQRITNQDGTPTAEFIQWAQQQRAFNDDIPDLTEAEGVSGVLDILQNPAPAAQGSILYRGASLWNTLIAGTTNLFLKTQGPGQNPIWSLVTWLGLSDTPNSYVGEAGRTVVVNVGETAMEFADAGGGGGGGVAAWEVVALTNADFETGDGTGWTTDIGSIRIEDWDAMTGYDTAGMTLGNNGTYFYNGGESGFGGAQAEVSSYQDIDISGDTGIIAYRLEVEGYKNFADSDHPYIQVDLLDSGGGVIGSEFLIGVTTVIGTERLEVVIHSHPDASNIRLRVGVLRSSGTNNNAGLDNVVFSKLSASGSSGGGTGLAGICVENPTASDNFVLRYFHAAITIQQLSFVLVGATNATVFMSFGPDRSILATDVINAGTVVANTTTGQIITSFDNASIPADSWLVIRVTALTGTPDQLHTTVAFNYD